MKPKQIQNGLLRNDKRHLHNLIYRKLSSIPYFSGFAGIVTGLLIAVVFGGMPLLIWNFVQSVNWPMVYIVLWVIYLTSRWVFGVDTYSREMGWKS